MLQNSAPPKLRLNPHLDAARRAAPAAAHEPEPCCVALCAKEPLLLELYAALANLAVGFSWGNGAQEHADLQREPNKLDLPTVVQRIVRTRPVEFDLVEAL